MSRKEEHLSEPYCSTGQPKPSGKSDSDGSSSWKKSGVSVSTKSLQRSSSYDNKSLYDSGRTDSGFLSGANLLSSEQYLSEEISTPSSSFQKSKEFETSGEIKSEEKIMRLDSGVDVGLYDQFSTLSLVDNSTNDLNISTSSKPKTEISCSNISAPFESNISVDSSSASDDKKKSSPLTLSWEIYFQQDEDGDTQLHIAILHYFIEVVYSLIRMAPHPKYLDTRNDIYQTPLHLAVLTGQPHVVRWLLSEGASPDVLDNNGNTPLHLAVSMQDICCVNALTSPVSADSQSPIVKSSAPVYINRYNYDGLTCLHLAVMGGNVDIIKCLLDYGADVNAREFKSGLTPLHIAIQMQNDVVCEFLLNYCRATLDLEMPTYAGITAYQLASQEHPSVAVYLQQRGAKWYPLEDSDDSEYDDEDDDDDDDQMFGSPRYSPFSGINGTNGMVNVSA